MGFFAWVDHVDDAYFGQQSIPQWTLEDLQPTLEEKPSYPSRYPNCWRNPLSEITLVVPGEREDDPQRGPDSPRHTAWNASRAKPGHFDWVPLDRSLQWQAFQRVIGLLTTRGNEPLVILGPFNEWMVAEDQRSVFRALRDGIAGWLEANHIPHVVPETLASNLYADASHPLTEGYEKLAQQICQDVAFQKWWRGSRH